MAILLENIMFKLSLKGSNKTMFMNVTMIIKCSAKASNLIAR